MGILKNLNPQKAIEEQMKVTAEGFDLTREANRVMTGLTQKTLELKVEVQQLKEIIAALIEQLKQPLQMLPMDYMPGQYEEEQPDQLPPQAQQPIQVEQDEQLQPGQHTAQ